MLTIFLAIFFIILFLLYSLNQKKYFYSIAEQKVRLLQMLSSVNSDITHDQKQSSIDPKDIGDIKTSIIYLTEELKIFGEKVEKKGSESEKRFAIQIINDFHNNLSKWMMSHQNELKLLEMSLENQKSKASLSEYKDALELVQKRLESQRENYHIIQK